MIVFDSSCLAWSELMLDLRLQIVLIVFDGVCAIILYLLCWIVFIFFAVNTLKLCKRVFCAVNACNIAGNHLYMCILLCNIGLLLDWPTLRSR